MPTWLSPELFNEESYYDGYSRHGGKEDMVEQLKESMMNARSEDERENYRRAIEALNR